MVQIRLRALIAEDVLKMICAKRAAILPLRVAEAIPFANGNPTMAADRLPRPGVGLLEPRDNQRRFGLELAVRDVVIRLSLIHISEPTRLLSISYAVFCLKK